MDDIHETRASQDLTQRRKGAEAQRVKGRWAEPTLQEIRHTECAYYLRFVGDPHGGGPDELAVGLFAADVVVGFFAGGGILVGPGFFELGGIWFGENVLDV